MTRARGSNQPIVTPHNLRVALTEAAKQTRGTLDIGKQERDRPSRQPRHGPWLRPARTHVKAHRAPAAQPDPPAKFA
jgi:hypothetical protein